MRRFKQWLILKLGGFLHEKVVEVKYIEPETTELITSAVRRDYSTCLEQSDFEHIDKKIKEHLAFDLTKNLIDKGLIRFACYKINSVDNVPQIHYFAKIRVYKNKGAFDERGKAD